MNVIVKKHYPVEKLPADLREGLSGDGPVEVRLTQEALDSASEGGHFSRFFHLRRDHFRTVEEVAAHLDQLRGERDR